jgi:hypothetical protein
MGMKDLGVRDLDLVESRAFRLLSMGRVEKQDADHISQECGKLRQFIMDMEESDGKAIADQAAGAAGQ